MGVLERIRKIRRGVDMGAYEIDHRRPLWIENDVEFLLDLVERFYNLK